MLFEQGVSREADSLNDQWDTWKTIGNNYGTAGWLPQIGKLHAMVSPPHTSALDRVWRNVQRRNSISTIATRNLGSSKAPRLQRRDWSRIVMPTRLALTAILLLVMAIPIGLGPARHLFEEDGALSTIPALGPSTATAMVNTAPFEFETLNTTQPIDDESVEAPLYDEGRALVQTRMSSSDSLTVGLWKVTLQGGKGFQLNTEAWDYTRNPAIMAPSPVGVGNLTYSEIYKKTDQGGWFPGDAPIGIINKDADPIEVLVLVPESEAGTFPLSSELPDGGAETIEHMVSIGQPPAGETLTSIPVTVTNANLTVERLGAFELDSGVYQWEIRSIGIYEANPVTNLLEQVPGQDMLYVARMGDATIVNPGASATPITAKEGTVEDISGAIGLYASEGSSGIVIAATPKSDNPTLDQTVRAVAPMDGYVDIADDGFINVQVKEIILGPEGFYSAQAPNGALYFLDKGKGVSLSTSEQYESSLPRGAILFQTPGNLYSFTNDEPGESARLIQVLLDKPTTSIGSGETIHQGTITPLITQEMITNPGTHFLSLSVATSEMAGEDLPRGYHESGLVIVTPYLGIVRVAGNGQGYEVHNSQGTPQATQPPGEPGVVAPGSIFTSSGGSGFNILASEDPFAAVVISIKLTESNQQVPGPTMVATPAP